MSGGNCPDRIPHASPTADSYIAMEIADRPITKGQFGSCDEAGKRVSQYTVEPEFNQL